MIITLDTGTTNTRLRLFDGETLLDTEKCKVGVRNTTQTGSNQLLKTTIAGGIRALLARNGKTEADIECIVASGMIGSELGLYALAHIAAPAGLTDLARSCCTVSLPEVSAIPFCFIPGVKNRVDSPDWHHPEDMDVMRGEETEFCGIQRICGLSEPLLAVLPGSHTKLIVSDGEKMLSCHTSMTGELLTAAAEYTILKNALPTALYDALDPEALQVGCAYCDAHGINESLFRLRMMKMFTNATDAERAGFFFGVILSGDVQLILRHAENRTVVIGGPEPLRSALETLLRSRCTNPIRKLTDEEAEQCVSAGALAVYAAGNG